MLKNFPRLHGLHALLPPSCILYAIFLYLLYCATLLSGMDPQAPLLEALPWSVLYPLYPSSYFSSLVTLLDPTPFAAFGVLGGLLFALAVFALLIWRLFLKQSEMFEKRDNVLIDFARETHQSMDNVASKVALSHNQLSSTLSSSFSRLEDVIARHTRKLDDFLLTREVLSKVDQMKRRGDPLDETVVERVVRTIIQERREKD